jgi:hypothetical protein
MIALCMTALAGCSTLSFDHEPVMHTPFAETRWRALPEEPVHERESPQKTATNLRQRMVDAALTLLDEGGEREDYGTSDLAAILKKAGASVDWNPSDGLDTLQQKAQKKGAYRANGMTEPGDIVLFHNQLDANQNGENDDWLTGAGVIVESRGARFEAVIRTGNAPRRISAWPDRPSLRMHQGKVVNAFVRIPQRTDPEDTAYLAGQLYAGHIDIGALTSK